MDLRNTLTILYHRKKGCGHVKRITALAVTICLILSFTGCNWMDGSYVSVTPHRVGYARTDDHAPLVSDYIDLRSSIINLIDDGTSEAVLLLGDYLQEDVKKDMIRVKNYVLKSYPIGAYSVDSIDYSFGTNGGQNALSLNITYRHPKSEIDQIRTVHGISGATGSISDALNNHRNSLVLLITGYEDTDFVQWISDYVALHPNIVMELPQVSAQVYPDQGDARVVELLFTYQNSRDSLRQMQNQVKPIFSSAELYVSSDADEQTKFAQLYAFLMERFDYTFETSLTPSYSLLCHGVGDSKAFAQVYSAMCRQIGLECITISGSYHGEARSWNMVQVNGVYYHIDLIQSYQSGKLQLMTDSQMAGYVWDYSAYPSGGTAVPTSTESKE